MKSIIFTLAIFFCIVVCNQANAQSSNISFFGSYNLGYGNIISKVNSELGYPMHDHIDKLRSGSTNQFEIGAFYKSLGVAFIHNKYGSTAETSYTNADVNKDGIFEDGILNDDLSLSFNGVELLYKTRFLTNKMNTIWRCALGTQKYSIDKYTQVFGTYPSEYKQKYTGNVFTSMLGVEIDYNLFKHLSIGIETSLLPGKYKKLKSEGSEFTAKEMTTRLSTGAKIIITL